MDDESKVMATVRRILKQFGELPQAERAFALVKMMDAHERKTREAPNAVPPA